MGNSLLEQEPLKNWAVTVELCRNQFHFCQSERIIQVMFIGQNHKSLNNDYTVPLPDETSGTSLTNGCVVLTLSVFYTMMFSSQVIKSVLFKMIIV